MQTIGERLEDARKKKGVSVREAAEATKIRGEYIQKFEGNQFDIGLSEIYVRGFLRSYAAFLRLPVERIANDYAALGRGEARPRQPSREVYGRMDLTISTAEERAERAASPAEEPPAPAPAARTATRFPRTGNSLPKAPAIDPAILMKGGKWAALAAAAILVVWGAKALFTGGSAHSNAAAGSRGMQSVADNGEALSSMPAAAPSITVVALDNVKIKVVRRSDNVELFQGDLQAGERRDYPGVPIYLTASRIESVAIEYRGKRYPTPPGMSGRSRVQFDPTLVQ